MRKLVGIAAQASGTNHAAGGTTLVGEHGPELVNLPQGSQVTQAYRTRQSESQSSRSGTTVVIHNMNVNNGRDEKRLLRDIGFALEAY